MIVEKLDFDAERNQQKREHGLNNVSAIDFSEYVRVRVRVNPNPLRVNLNYFLYSDDQVYS